MADYPSETPAPAGELCPASIFWPQFDLDGGSRHRGQQRLSAAAGRSRIVGWFGIAEVSTGARPEVGVRHLVVADPVDVPETEPVGVLVEDAAGLDLDVVQAAARSVHTEDAVNRPGLSGDSVWCEPASG